MGTGQPPAAIRFFCRVTPRPRRRPGTPILVALRGVIAEDRVPPAVFWDRLANQYARALSESELGLCCMSTARSNVDLVDEDSHWHALTHRFMAPVADRYVNVVCCDNGELQTYFTVGAAANVAITGTYPRPPNEVELKALRHYDAVWCPRPEWVDTLRALDVRCDHIPAEPRILHNLLKELLA